jgi:tRNA U34 5-methylaminomethyl-2-thiouridine-forming methyltransferase MnmC
MVFGYLNEHKTPLKLAQISFRSSKKIIITGKSGNLHNIVTTSDGSHTIFVPELNEHFHSVHGAVQESEHIFSGAGYDSLGPGPASILEIGFGTGLNALLTAVRNLQDGKSINYTSIEKYPLSADIVSQLNYHRFAGEKGRQIFRELHTARWEEWTDITETFRIRKIMADLTVYEPAGSYDLIYFDAFGPDKQPEMWTKEIFEKIAAVTGLGGIFVTYSAKGTIKRQLRACGFSVELLAGPPGKRQMIRAVKI